MKFSTQEARSIADEFLSSIFGPEDQRQPVKADEMAELLMAAYARGHEAHVPHTLKAKAVKAVAEVKKAGRQLKKK